MKKKIITLILLFISIISFGQNKEYKKAVNLFNDKKYTEANIIVEKLLNKEFGDLDEVTELYTLNMNLNCYIYANDFKTAYTKAEVYFAFIKNSKNIWDEKNKNNAITETEKIITDLKLKIPQDNNSTSDLKIASESSENKTVDSSKPASDDKTVTLTVSGTGKTLEEAKLNALRSAIEQAFGAFVSSKTEILNDNLVKDEIVSVTNGNIQKYNVVTAATLPNGSFAITLNATVSIEKLTSFAQSKGVEVEFKGGMFGLKIKLQKLNEQNELQACINLFGIIHETLQTSYDYSITTEDPVLYVDDIYKIKFKVDAVPNQTYKSIYAYFEKSLEGLKMTTEEIEAYKKINKEIFEIKTPTAIYYLRNELSKQTLDNINQLTYYYSGNFKVLINNDEINAINGPDLGFIVNVDSSTGREISNSEITKCSFFMGDTYDLPFNGLSAKSKSYIENQNGKIVYSWEQFYSLKELENISKITIQGKGLKSNFKYGGFVVYNNDNKLIIVAPYTLNLANAYNVNTLYWKPEKTSETIFSGKANTELFKDETQTNTLYSLLNNFNIKNNTNWFIPSKEELIVAMKEIYKFSYRKHISYISSTISPSRYGSNDYGFKQLFIYEDFKINSNSFSNEKLKKYLNGNPFHIADFLENANKSDIGYEMEIKGHLSLEKLMLIKYNELNK